MTRDGSWQFHSRNLLLERKLTTLLILLGNVPLNFWNIQFEFPLLMNSEKKLQLLDHFVDGREQLSLRIVHRKYV